MSLRSVYKQRDQILITKKHYYDDVKEKKPELLVLDSAYKLRVLIYEDERKQTGDISLIEIRTYNLTDHNIKRVIRGLMKVPWAQCLLSRRVIVSNLALLKKDKGNKD